MDSISTCSRAVLNSLNSAVFLNGNWKIIFYTYKTIFASPTRLECPSDLVACGKEGGSVSGWMSPWSRAVTLTYIHVFAFYLKRVFPLTGSWYGRLGGVRPRAPPGMDMHTGHFTLFSIRKIKLEEKEQPEGIYT